MSRNDFSSSKVPGSLRILHCMRAPVGGLFRHVRDLATEQARHGHDVGLVCDALTGGEAAVRVLAELEKDCRLGITRIAMGRLPGISDLRIAAKIGRIAERGGVKILHGHGAKGGAYARLAPVGRAAGPVHRFYTPHGGSLHYAPRSISGMVYLSLERLLLRRTDGLLFESAYGRDTFTANIATPHCPSRVVHNGVRPEEFAPVATAPDAADILFIGEMRAIKGLSTLLRAVAKLTAEGAPVSAVLVGDGNEREKFRAEAEQLGLTDRIAFRPAMPAREAFTLARLLVVPSFAESLPYVVLEAAAAGVPLVATDVGGIPEIFGPLADALVTPGDAVALAEAIDCARADPAALAQRTGRLRARVEKMFSAAAMSEDILSFYRAAAGAGRD